MHTLFVSGQLHRPLEGFSAEVALLQFQGKVRALNVVSKAKRVAQGGVTYVAGDGGCRRQRSLDPILPLGKLRGLIDHGRANVLHEVVIL